MEFNKSSESWRHQKGQKAAVPWMNSQAQGKGLLDCCMIAAKLFCSIEQTTPVFDWWRQCLEPQMRPCTEITRSHDNTKDKWFPRWQDTVHLDTLDGTMSDMCNGCWCLSVRVLKPWVLYPMAMAMYWREGWAPHICRPEPKSEPIITTLDAWRPKEMSDSHSVNVY